MEDLLKTEIWNGRSLADVLTIEFIATSAGNVVTVIAIILAAIVVSGWVNRKINQLARRHASLDDTLFNFLANITRYVILAFAMMFVLNTFGVQTTSVVAIFGAASLAIGLALQGTLSNIAAGVMIILFRPIKIGDFVEVNDKTGTVQDISLNYTELAGVSNIQIIVPNSQVWGNTIENYSVYETRRAEWVFGVGYGASLKQAEEIIRDTIMADPRSMIEPEPFIQVNNLGDFSVDFLVRVWVSSDAFFAYQADMKRLVKEALDDAGIEIPFPTRTILSSS
ncbi:MAG: mechanosensitive ion channel domain-containing protein [Litoreibacter sp.]